MTDKTTEEQIRDAMTSPKKITTDTGTVEERSVSELIEADKYIQSRKVAQSKGNGLKVQKIVAPGAV